MTPGWYEHYDDSDLEITATYVGSWSTDHWVACGPYATHSYYTRFVPIGTWADGFRPTQLRVTFDGAANSVNFYMELEDGHGMGCNNIAAVANPYTSEIPDYDSDVAYVRFYSLTAFNISKIEWYYPEIERTITESAEASDAIEFFSLTDSIEETAEASDSIAVEMEYNPTITETAAAADVLAGFREMELDPITETATAGDSIDAFNWTTFLTQYEDLLITRFYFTLTGAEDGVADAELSISSFNCRLRSGDPTYLQVVVPGVDDSAVIAARSNGQLVIEMDYLLSNVSQHREEIVRVDLEDINIYEGGKNKSIVLLGHKTVAHVGKIVDLKHVSYQATVSGDQVARAAIDMYLKPGDTVRYDGDTFVVGSISIVVGEKTRTMEVNE